MLLLYPLLLAFSAFGKSNEVEAIEGPQYQVSPSLFYPSARVHRIRSRVFRDASQGYNTLIDSPRLYRASGRFHKRVQSATTHDIQSVPLPQDSVQIVSYKYDAEKHNEKKMTSNDILSSSEVEDHVRTIERTTMAVRVREEETTTPLSTTTTPHSTTTTTPSPIDVNSINEVAKPKTYFQTVTANGPSPPPPVQAPPQPPSVFTPPPPPISPPTFNSQPPAASAPPPPQQPPFQPIMQVPHQPSSQLVGPPQQPLPPPPPQPQQQSLAQTALSLTGGGGLLTPRSALSPNNPDNESNILQNGENSSSHEQLGCGWDWLSNSCKDLFNLNWCGKCHDFGNIFLHDCKCVAPLIPLPTTVPPAVQVQPLQVAGALPQRHPLFFWLN